jgi:release factor glutamine methyltransferase
MMPTIKTRGVTVGETLDTLIFRLEKKSDLPGLDSQVLIAYLMGRSRSWILAHPEAILAENRVAELEAMVVRFEEGEPLPYILGTREFFNLNFVVTPDVLIPRPETELLVERAIDWLRIKTPVGEKLSVLDVGTGSGCIATSLAVSITGLSITAIDISKPALEVALGNAIRMNVSGSITFLESDLFSNSLIPTAFSLVVANPPYIPTRTLYHTIVFGREPTLALDGGTDGLALIRRILTDVPGRLLPGGLLLMEIEASEGPAVLSLASTAFPKARIKLHKDLSGHDRLLEVQA